MAKSVDGLVIEYVELSAGARQEVYVSRGA